MERNRLEAPLRQWTGGDRFAARILREDVAEKSGKRDATAVITHGVEDALIKRSRMRKTVYRHGNPPRPPILDRRSTQLWKDGEHVTLDSRINGRRFLARCSTPPSKHQAVTRRDPVIVGKPLRVSHEVPVTKHAVSHFIRQWGSGNQRRDHGHYSPFELAGATGQVGIGIGCYQEAFAPYPRLGSFNRYSVLIALPC